MTIRQLTAIAALCALSSAGPVRAEPNPETQAGHDARMGWFREARFGMFVHWGLYSVPAGEWKGEKYGGGVEWIQNFAKFPGSEYTPLIKRFNPVKCDADVWVRLAKEADMKHLAITSKHHEGFRLRPSAQTDWDVASTR